MSTEYSNEVLDYIDEHADELDYIEDNDQALVFMYNNLFKDTEDSGAIGEFSWFLLNELNINPLNILKDNEVDALFYDCDDLRELVIPEGITKIFTYEFCGCSNLRNIKLPESLQEVERYAFSRCKSLKEITLPENVKYIGSDSFKRSGIHTVNIEADRIHISPHAFYHCEDLQEVNFLGDYSGSLTSSIGESAFEGCKNLKQLILPDGVTLLNTSCLESCTSLRYLELPSSVKTVGYYAIDVTPDDMKIKVRGCNSPEQIQEWLDSVEFPDWSYKDKFRKRMGV